MTKHSLPVRGFLFAAAFAFLAFLLRRPLIDLAPPRILDVFLIGIGLTAYFFSATAALVLLIASLAITNYSFPITLNAPDLLRLALYTGVALGGIYGIDKLRSAVAFWRRTEATCRTVFEDASDAIAVTDGKLKILEVNIRMAELLGYARDELNGRSFRDLIARTDLTRDPLRIEEVMAGRKTIVQEREYLRKDGTKVLCETSLRALRDGRLVAIARDITERRRAEDAVRESEALTRAVLYSAVDGIITTDDRGLIRSFNPAAERLFGFPADEVIGRNVSLLMPSPYREEHDGYIRRYLESGLGRVIGAGREVVGLRRDGTTFPVELALSDTVTAAGRIFTGIIRDLTHRRQAEEAIREAHQTLRAVIDTSPLAICVSDLDGRVKSWNPAAERIFGWSEGEVLGQLLPTIPESDWDQFRQAVDGARRGEPLFGIERRRRRKGGGTVDVAIWNAALRDREGSVTGIVAVFADVTERRRLEEQLRQSQKMEAIGRLAGGVAHDFNNILTIITGYGEMISEKLAGRDERAEIEEVLKAADHASSLTSQLLVFSRHRVVNPQVLDLNSVVARLKKMLLRVIGEDIELITVAAPDLAPVRADSSQMEQVILNLAVNARDAMPHGGRLLIETANVTLDPAYARSHIGVTPGRFVMLAVSDTGVGMDAETRARLFEPFFTTKEKGKGTGLGLSTVYGIVKQCNGEIWVYSEPSKGSTFKIYLPVVEQPSRAAAMPEMVPIAGGAETILLVEDEASVRKLVRNLLEDQGYTVIEAADPKEALAICEQRRDDIHLLLTDVVMPHMSGRDLADRAVASRPGLRVLFMSGYTDNVIVHHGVAAGETAFLQKPFTPGTLARKVRQVLDA